MSLSAGQKLTYYEILGPLGAGGMGEVYLAKDMRLEREVAIKVLPEGFADDEERLRRFEREAKTLALLNHPNVAGIHGVDQVDDVCFLALELVPGEDLAARIARGPLSVDEAVEVCRQIAEGLESAHEAGVVHRDLKPANVRVTPEDIVKVLDFGLAKPVLPEASGGSGTTTAESDSFLMTQEGLVLGTPTYMSPEQARGKPVDRRTDIWAFGCVLFECLTGRRPFDGSTVGDVLAGILEREPDWSLLPRNTPPRLRALMERCLEKDPRRRLRDIGEARLQLEPGAVEGGAQVEEGASSGALRGSLLGAAVGGAMVLVLAWFFGDGEKAGLGDLHISIPARAEYRRPSEATISPDGRAVLFSALDEDGEKGLWLRTFDAFEARSIPGTEDASGAFWSPEGDSIGFFRDGAMGILRLGEEVPRVVPATEEGRSGVWSSTGEIVYGGSEGPLYAVPSTGGEPRTVTRLDTAAGEFAHSLPTFLPDGDRFLYLGLMLNTQRLSGEVREHRLCVGSLSSEESSVLRPFPSRPIYTDRGELVYIDDGRIRAVPFDASSLEFTGEARTLASGVAFFKPIGKGSLSVARNGSLAFQAPAYSREIRWLDRRGIDLGRVGGSTSSAFGYRISPDGRRVAVGVTDPNNSLSDVWVWGLTRETKAQVTDGPFWEGEPI